MRLSPAGAGRMARRRRRSAAYRSTPPRRPRAAVAPSAPQRRPERRTSADAGGQRPRHHGPVLLVGVVWSEIEQAQPHERNQSRPRPRPDRLHRVVAVAARSGCEPSARWRGALDSRRAEIEHGEIAVCTPFLLEAAWSARNAPDHGERSPTCSVSRTSRASSSIHTGSSAREGCSDTPCDEATPPAILTAAELVPAVRTAARRPTPSLAGLLGRVSSVVGFVCPIVRGLRSS